MGRTESMMVEMGCVVAVSESCKIVAEERTGIIRESPYAQGFVVKITGELQTQARLYIYTDETFHLLF